VRKEALHDTAIRVAFDPVLRRTCSCGCLIGNRNTEYSTQGCIGHRSTGDPYFASSQGRSLLASEGFLNTMPEALWFGFACGVFTAAFFLAVGYIYRDAQRRHMPAWAWVIAASFIPYLIGFFLYFVFRGPLLGPCSSGGRPIRGEM
jgi:hypothetical protein